MIDDGRIVRQGEGVPGSVTAQIKEYLGNPLLEDQFEILGAVMQGKAHAKSGLVVFQAEDLTPTELTVFVQGAVPRERAAAAPEDRRTRHAPKDSPS